MCWCYILKETCHKTHWSFHFVLVCLDDSCHKWIFTFFFNSLTHFVYYWATGASNEIKRFNKLCTFCVDTKTTITLSSLVRKVQCLALIGWTSLTCLTCLTSCLSGLLPLIFVKELQKPLNCAGFLWGNANQYIRKMYKFHIYFLFKIFTPRVLAKSTLTT